MNPSNPDIVFVCALGRLTAPQQEHGVYRTTDGGAHWDRVLFADENTGCSGLSMDPHNPRVLFAGMWQAELHTWGELSGGPGSGVYVSRDGGTKWTRIEGHGLPKSPLGKIDVAVAPSEFEPRLRVDPDERSGFGLAVRRWRRELARHQLSARSDWPGGLLHSHRRFAGRMTMKFTSRIAHSGSRSMAARSFAKFPGAETITISGLTR